MRFLCLPGAFGSAEKYKVQLGPFVDEMKRDAPGDISFYFHEGSVPCSPPKGFEDYFGPPPHYRYVSYDGIAQAGDLIEAIRDFPEGAVPEDVMRQLFPSSADAPPEGYGDGLEVIIRSVQRAMKEIYDVIEKHGPFDGILGYSEGATMASTFILDEKRREAEEGRKRDIKAGIFFAGWPPMIATQGTMVLADDSDELIDIPTCHVVGAGDPYLHGSMALYNVCDEDLAIFFDHGKGHTLPRDQRTLRELSEAVRDMMVKAGDSGFATPKTPE